MIDYGYGWTDERVETLKKLWIEGLSASQIARQLGGVSRNAVIGKVHRLGMAGRAAPSYPSRPTFKSPRAPRPISKTAPQSSSSQSPRARSSEPYLYAVPAAAAVSLVAYEVGPTATVHTLTANACRWPIGEPTDDDFGFCGRLRSEHSPYCAGHAPMGMRRYEKMSGKKPATGPEYIRSLERYADQYL